MQSVQPNPGHQALVEFETLFASFTIVTQNIDGLHARAGSRRVLEVHGSLWRAHCVGGCGRVVDPFPFPAPTVPPPCECGGWLRPSVVLFGEILAGDVFAEATRSARTSQVAMSVGTSGAVWPAAGLPLVAAEAGAFTIEVNPEETDLTRHLDVSLVGPSGSVLPALLERVRSLRAEGSRA
jgi:NAD-dependent deacetylase